MLPDHDTCYRAIMARDTRFDGRLFTGVLTTGIYCRPVCPARVPNTANVTFYPSAAAAQEAGFRPCLRCRPETAPDTPAWRGTSATIGRALRLIEEGGLDESPVSRLAMRLGLGERQLRRLFLKHVGATPIAVAQTRRILLAKQLLHETQLPMAQVALASGFGSIRRFNEVFQALFNRPPSDIRRSIAPEVMHEGGGEIALKLRFRAPYEWAGVAQFLKARLYADVEAFVGETYCRSFVIDGVVGVIHIKQGGGHWLNAAIRCQDLSCLPKVIAKVRAAFDLASDPVSISEALKVDEHLSPLIGRRSGLRLPTSWDGFEGVVRAVLGQQITIKAAIALGQKLVDELGTSLPKELNGTSGVTKLFPTPIAIAKADLSFLPMPQSRRRTLSAIAQAFVDKPSLLDGEAKDVRASLACLPGVGPWTLDYIALRVLRDPDAFPSSDVALIKAMTRLIGTATSVKSLVAHSEAWRPWRSYAAQHLWASLSD
jgi:AraC family transcriptional regulator, regulatory protein of adaptative response / DNA-3-methyladenine glycosylase II